MQKLKVAEVGDAVLDVGCTLCQKKFRVGDRYYAFLSSTYDRENKRMLAKAHTQHEECFEALKEMAK
jgi:hypothetical protein